MQTWKSIRITGSTTGFKLMNEDVTRELGSIIVLDSTFKDTDTAILITVADSKPGSGTTGVMLDNIAFDNVKNVVADNTGRVYLSGKPGALGTVDGFVIGAIYDNSTTNRAYTHGSKIGIPRNELLVDKSQTAWSPNLPKQSYFEKSKPQYEGYTNSMIVHMKSYAKGIPAQITPNWMP